jgi:hypothetical protein
MAGLSFQQCTCTATPITAKPADGAAPAAVQPSCQCYAATLCIAPPPPLLPALDPPGDPSASLITLTSAAL